MPPWLTHTHTDRQTTAPELISDKFNELYVKMCNNVCALGLFLNIESSYTTNQTWDHSLYIPYVPLTHVFVVTRLDTLHYTRPATSVRLL